MKQLYAITPLVVLGMAFFLLLAPKSAQAQVSDTGDFLRALQDDTLNDVELLLGEYSRPYAEGLGAVSNSGWVKTAGTHGVLGFSLSLSLGIAAVPDSKGNFDLSTLGLTNIEASGPTSVTPTISGPDGTAVGVNVFADVPGLGRQEISTFDLPSGTDFAYTPAPMVQLGVGIPKNTELMLRFVPNVGIGDYGDFAIFGLGIKHELNQWIPAPLPVKLSVMGGYTNIDLSGSFTLAGSDIDYDEDPNNLDVAGTWEGQEANMNSNAWNANLLVGKELGPLGVYAGAGFQSSSFELSFDGRYPFLELETRENNGELEAVRVLSTIENPAQVEIDSGSVFRTMIGASLKIPFVRFNVDFTYAEYAVLNAGLGFTFR